MNRVIRHIRETMKHVISSLPLGTLSLCHIVLCTLSLCALLATSSFSLQAQPKHEMRAAWIATVANIDWPSKEAIGNSELQKKEMLFLLDSLASLRLNMVIFQIRPTADALYASPYEPWSHWLTGKQGQPNDKPYDPLTFVCEEAHKRCMDVHVWLNPYRVTTAGYSTAELDKSHIYNSKRHLFVKYGKQWYFNPGLDETRLWLRTVAADIVARYDIDGLHFDDYFYPYRVKGEEFPDDAAFRAHPRGFTDKDAWRRNNVNLIIQELHDTIHALKPWVEFGISPFGVWRNRSSDAERGSDTNAGVQNYDDLYADILLWQENGWIDYVVPQLYWEIGKTVADYQVLAHWWAKYSYGTNLYIGHSLSALGKSKNEAWMRPNEICRQIRLNRTIPQIQGSVFFPAHDLIAGRLGLCDSLIYDLYALPALPPSCFAERPLPHSPKNVQIEAIDNIHSRITWTPVDGCSRYIVYAFPTYADAEFDDAKYIIAITAENNTTINLDPEEFTICVTAFDRYHHESIPTVAEYGEANTEEIDF